MTKYYDHFNNIREIKEAVDKADNQAFLVESNLEYEQSSEKRYHALNIIKNIKYIKEKLCLKEQDNRLSMKHREDNTDMSMVIYIFLIGERFCSR